ncbi:MAG: hypothetical protein HY722_11930 [Planctomycetes bacterium]|nr:hypothetical protein [Planctomycetota bacterium]
MNEALRVERRDGPDGVDLYLSGPIDEDTLLAEGLGALGGRVRVHLAGVTRINSAGIRVWINTFRAVPPSVDLDFLDCPQIIVEQANQISNFIPRGRIASFYGPYACAPCRAREGVLIHVEAHREELRRGVAPEAPCPRCGQPMAFREFETEYFAFLDDER